MTDKSKPCALCGCIEKHNIDLKTLEGREAEAQANKP